MNAEQPVLVSQRTALIGPFSEVEDVDVLDSQVISEGLEVACASAAEGLEGSSSNEMANSAIKIESNVLTCVVAPHSQVHGPLTVTGSTIQTIVKQPPKCLDKLPLMWHLPHKNLNFVGRSDLLDKIDLRLKENNQQLVLTALNGLGGIGKTSVALHFAWTNCGKYTGVAWFRAETKIRLIRDYIELGSDLNLFHGYENSTPDEKARHVKHWLENPRRAGWLLVYDNAPGYGGEEGISELIPTKEGTVLITSRKREEWPPGSTLDVKVFESKESQAYIEKILGPVSSEAEGAYRAKLAATLGHLALALAQACAFIKKPVLKMSVKRYLELYETMKLKFFNDESLAKATDGASKEQMCVYTTWNITMVAIFEESKLAANWLIICAYLDGSAIQDFLLDKFSECATNNPEVDFCDFARATLHSYSMIDFNETSCCSSIHNVLQEVIKLKQEIDGNEEKVVLKVAQLLEECFPPGEEISEFGQKKELLPHFSILLPLLEQFSKKKKEHEKIYLQHILNQVAALGACEQYQEYIELAEKSIIILIDHYGSPNVLLAKALFNLSVGYGGSGNYGKQKELLEQAIGIFRKCGSGRERYFGIALRQLGEAYANLGEYATQKKILEEAIPILKETAGIESVDVAVATEHLGLAFGFLGNHDQEKILLEEALKIKKLCLGSNHVWVAKTLFLLGVVYGALGSKKEQVRLLQEAYEIQVGFYGTKHYEVAQTLRGLASAYGMLKDYNKQNELLEECLDVIKLYFGAQHVQTAQTLVLLGNAHGDLHDYEKMVEHIQTAITIFKKEYRPDHAQVGLALNNLGIAYSNLGKHKEQKEVLEEALQIAQNVYASNSIELAMIRDVLANAHVNLCDYDKEKELLTEAVKEFGPGRHPHIDKMRERLKKVKQCTYIHEVAQQGYLDELKKLIERGANLFTKTEDNCTVLHFAVKCKNKEVVRFVLQTFMRKDAENLGSYINFQDNEGNTALVWAVCSGKVDFVKVLLEFGADVNVACNKDNTALHYAVHKKFPAIVSLLLDKQANCHAQNKSKMTPLAVAMGHLQQNQGGEIENIIFRMIVQTIN